MIRLTISAVCSQIMDQTEESQTRVQRSRAGFSLIEVIMATAFLMGSAIVLSKLAGMGRDQSQKAQLQLQAQQLCEQTLCELLLGLRPFEVTEAAPLLPLVNAPGSASENQDLRQPTSNDQFESLDSLESQPNEMVAEPEWQYALRMEPLNDKPGMWAVTVVVEQTARERQRPMRFSLTRWVAGPVPSEAFENLLPQDSTDDSMGRGVGP